MQSLAEVNREFERDGTLPAQVWDEWLWGSDPEEPCDPEVLLNRNHLLGVLVCRFKGLQDGPPLRTAGRLEIIDKHPHDMSWRELKDTLSNVQLEWPSFMQRLARNENARDNLLAAKALIDASAARFGRLCGSSWPDAVMDDMSDAQPGDGGLKELTAGAMRRTAGLLLVLYRHLHWLAVCKPPPLGTTAEISLARHHHEASMGEFYLWHMHFQLPVAGRLNYRHDFPGMYNHVTQPVYFHNPDYQRSKRQVDGSPPAIHLLPSLCQLHPEVPVRFEDELLPRDKSWYWLVTAGRVYLCGADTYYSEDARALLGLYLAQRALVAQRARGGEVPRAPAAAAEVE